jgi:hypothetical protein
MLRKPRYPDPFRLAVKTADGGYGATVPWSSADDRRDGRLHNGSTRVVEVEVVPVRAALNSRLGEFGKKHHPALR